jgi:hypothetical protein
MMLPTDLVLHAIVLIAALAFTSLVQLMSVRLSGGKIGVVLSLFVGFVGGLIVLILGEAAVAARAQSAVLDNLAVGLANLVLFVCCWYFYFHFINIGEASLRIRVLREVERIEGRPVEHLLEAYNVRTVVETRVQRLLSDGQLVRQGDLLAPGKPRMILVSKAFALLRLLLLGKAAQPADNT